MIRLSISLCVGMIAGCASPSEISRSDSPFTTVTMKKVPSPSNTPLLGKSWSSRSSYNALPTNSMLAQRSSYSRPRVAPALKQPTPVPQVADPLVFEFPILKPIFQQQNIFADAQFAPWNNGVVTTPVSVISFEMPLDDSIPANGQASYSAP